MAAMSGRRHSAPLRVVALPKRRPCERGKSSYQAPRRARSRSTMSGTSWSRRLDQLRFGWRRTAASSSIPVSAAAAVRSLRARRLRSRASRMRCRSGRASAASARAMAPLSSSRPSASSVATGTLASTFLMSPSRQEPHASRQASMVYRWRPTRPRVMRADHRSFSMSRIGTSRQAVSSSLLSRRTASSRSCPSATMSAVTSRWSPTTRFAGCRPPSISGEMRSMTIVRRVPISSGPGSRPSGRPGSACPSAINVVFSAGVRASRMAWPSRSRGRLAASAATRRRLARVVVIVRLKPYPITTPASGSRDRRPAPRGSPK